MDVIQAIILGIIQGFTEFLPVSSSGHLRLTQMLFGITDDVMIFDIVVHVGTLVPVFIIFWGDIKELIKKPFQKMTYLLVAATIPTVVFTLLFYDRVSVLFENAVFLAFGFTTTGILLILADKMSKGRKTDKEITYKDAVIIGCVQGLGIAPSISRSGSTITAGLSRGLNKSAAAKFSFLMSIPAILGGLIYHIVEVVNGSAEIEAVGALPLLVGFVTAMVCGYIAIKFFLNLIRRQKLRYFSVYLFILASLILFDIFITQRFVV
ncbi:MAG: undecaprenyl-diphosphate phosphatase [Defluviitaleaceae bacterium]|nr:undecaprenyl-diphosphate phosphatase [Defluviitaleaceae bacterium]